MKTADDFHTAEKKELLLRARYDALAASGGRLAVKKAIEKKQKKQGQKEKRSRPFAPTSGDGPEGRKQRRSGPPTGSNDVPLGGPPRKRQRTRK